MENKWKGQLVCSECRYCLTTQERSLNQCPKCGSNKLREIKRYRSSLGQTGIKKSTANQIIIFLIGFIFLMAGIGVLYVSMPVGISLIIFGFVLLVIGSKGEICCYC